MKYIYLLLFAVAMTSCGDDFKDEYEEKRSQIVGEWQLNESIQTHFLGQIIDSLENVETIVLQSDGTGHKTVLSEIQTINWLYQPLPEKVAIEKDPFFSSQGFGTLGGNDHFDVLTNTVDKQVWISYGSPSQSIDSSSHEFVRVIQWELTRQ